MDRTRRGRSNRRHDYRASELRDPTTFSRPRRRPRGQAEVPPLNLGGLGSGDDGDLFDRDEAPPPYEAPDTSRFAAPPTYRTVATERSDYAHLSFEDFEARETGAESDGGWGWKKWTALAVACVTVLPALLWAGFSGIRWAYRKAVPRRVGPRHRDRVGLPSDFYEYAQRLDSFLKKDAEARGEDPMCDVHMGWVAFSLDRNGHFLELEPWLERLGLDLHEDFSEEERDNALRVEEDCRDEDGSLDTYGMNLLVVRLGALEVAGVFDASDEESG